MPLSFSITSRLALLTPALFSASKASPPVIEPSPMTAICCRWRLPCSFDAMAMPSAAEIDVDEWPVPKAS